MKYSVLSLGCKVNSYECSALKALLNKRGYIEDNAQPDIVIVNTCSVTGVADQKSRQHIRKMQKSFPLAIVVAMGCYVQGNSEYVKNELKPQIIVGTSNRNKIPELIDKYLATHQQIVLVEENPRHFCYEELGTASCSENVRAYLKVQDGCDNFCSYCIIPYRRGKSRSRDPQKIIEEAKFLLNSQYKEIVLTGIDVSSYGKDLGDITFSELIERLLQLDGLQSLRISSIEASEISDDLINLFYKYNNLAHHMHIPLQSGSESVQKRMNRKYTKEVFLAKINKLKQTCQDIALSTDVIVGFPGETEEEFTETVEFIKNCGFHMLHVFPYSSRKGTAAEKFKNQISPDIKNSRSKVLLDLSKQLWEKYVNNFIGKEVKVLIERYNEKEKINIGHTSNYIEVAVPSNEGKVGQFISVILEKSMIISK